MKFAYTWSGTAPHIRKLKTGTRAGYTDFATAGIPALVGAGNAAGVVIGDSDTCQDAVGVTIDTGSYSATQGDTEGIVSVIVNPDAVYKLLMSGSNTTGAALNLTTNSAASAAGTVVTITTGDVAPNGPTMDEGMAACISGANFGQTRKITSVAATTATVTVPFLRDIDAGDTFLLLPYAPFDVAANDIELTTDATGANASIAVGTGANFRVVDYELDFYGAPRTNSYVLAMLDDHVTRENT